MMLEFTVGINIAGKHESVTVAAEDALIAALKGEMRAAGCHDQLRAAAQQARRSASSPRVDLRQGQVIGQVTPRR